MKRIGDEMKRVRAAGTRALLGAAALTLLLSPVGAQAPNTEPGVKRTTFDGWQLLCKNQSCAATTTAVRAVIVFGYAASDKTMVMQVRLPTDAPEGRPVAIRLHKSGTVLQLRVGNCSKVYCLAAAAADKIDQVIEVLGKETSGTLGYQLGQQMQLEVFSLKGFTKAISELRKRKPK
jgi:invasion protein IalB